MSQLFEKHNFIAHRGLHNEKIAENSLSAFNEAIKNNYAFELDVHIIKDGSIIVFHDENLKRMCNEDKSIYDLTLKELKTYNLLNTTEKIPTLKEVLNQTNGKVPILIEIKDNKHKNIVQKTLEIIKDYNGEIAFQSFNPLYLRKIKKLAPKFKTCLLWSKLDANDTPKNLKKITKFILYKLLLFKFCKATFISAKLEDLNKTAIKKAKGNLIVWCITSNNQLAKAKEISKNFIFENLIV
jgi:glycerophosphoryl diester phosphodiesterase